MSGAHGQAPPVSIIVINYNGKEFLQQCLSSVLRSDYHNFETILVDNCSTDRSVELVEKFFESDPRIRMVRNEKNLGPAAGRNKGAKIAMGKYIAFLDHDTEVEQSWLGEAVRVMECDSAIGAAQCKLLLMDSHNRYDYAGDYLATCGFLIQRVEMGERDDGRLDEIADIFGVKSAGMIIRREVFEEVGGFDQDYFIYLEETDLCWRVWLKGYRVVYIPRSIVYHAFGRIPKLASPYTKFLAKYHGTKNYIATLLKNLGTWNLLRILPVHIGFWLGLVIWHILRRRLIDARWIMRGMLWNLTNIKLTWIKRQGIQRHVRKVPDNRIMPRVLRKQSFTYFYDKLSRPTSGWRL